MLLAYRRGLLKPQLSYGITSRLRENLLLTVLDRELQAEDVYNTMLYDSVTIAPNLDPKKVIGYIEKKHQLRDYLSEYKLGSPKRYARTASNVIASSEGLRRAFQILKENGIIDKIKRRNAKWERERALSAN